MHMLHYFSRQGQGSKLVSPFMTTIFSRRYVRRLSYMRAWDPLDGTQRPRELPNPLARKSGFKPDLNEYNLGKGVRV
ncbi:hypothetical protein M407DRAFT_242783 [Tulasnella calospora MUT 4182]|uniref:Uncharacterized protein n=1 Tax=Tulasnella calospora MUT 4182 TaxID=1051891 RepID=A0A0C3L5B4_9AGAM|nr:hypothetical protein M407DRAFT_242783 [Tulasnella calospora MUT 4182]